MKWALSNIMWGDVLDQPYLELAAELGFSGIEIAPGLLNKSPMFITSLDARKFKNRVNEFDLEIASFHALFFGFPSLKLFGISEEREKAGKFLFKLGQIAHEMECPVMVLGSPNNRRKGLMSDAQASSIAKSFFQSVVEKLSSYGVSLCIEPLPPEETDYINNYKDAIDIVEAVDRPFFRMMLDAKAMLSETEEADSVIINSFPWMNHFHVNDPQLRVPMSTGEIDHSVLGAALHKVGYDRYVSLEVTSAYGTPEQNIKDSHAVLEKYY
jgi:D-psicose/D-tagatose/L-ribulose 3-epimerase